METSWLVRHRRFFKQIGFLIIVFFCSNPFCAYSSEAPIDLTALSIEDLMNLEITSVSKKAQSLFDAPAAIFVITQDDIRRSSATSIPEVLRMVPGLEVAHIDSNKWAISARGFNGRFANALLVLIDGRSVYSPLFSGVFWDVQDTMLEDIERIEIIRGPGASLWGANAVNGVINIITKNARDTQGGLISGGAGTEERVFGGIRYGARIGEGVYVRAYAKYFDRDNFVFPSGIDAADDWHIVRGGFRADVSKSSQDSYTLQGDIYSGKVGQTITIPTLTHPFAQTFDQRTDISGGNVLFRWRHNFSEQSDMSLQLYYDRTERCDETIGENRDTFDLDFQHHFTIAERHEIIWGLGYRLTKDHITNSFTISFDPDKRTDDLFNLFIQDEITLVQNVLRLTVGSKFEHNDYTGIEIQPTIRLNWKPHEGHSLWGAISRAVRTPSRAEHDVTANSNPLSCQACHAGIPSLPMLVRFKGNSNFKSEELIAYEAGYRTDILNTLSVDIAAFYNNYRNMGIADPGEPFLEMSPPPMHIIIPFTTANAAKWETYGIEIATNWSVTNWWQIHGAYTYLNMKLKEDVDDPSAKLTEGQNPHHQFSLRSSMNLRKNVELDLWFRYVDELPDAGVKSYFTFDTRLGWKPSKNLELSLVGQNLLDNQHPEQGSEMTFSSAATEVQRGIYGKVTWRF